MRGWHILRDGATLTVARRRPVVWTVAVDRVLMGQGSRLRLAQQIRQDLWRALRRQRGVLPAVAVTRGAGQFTVRAGGQIEATHDAAHLEALIATVLDAPANRARWLRSASIRVQVIDDGSGATPRATHQHPAGEEVACPPSTALC